MVRLQLLSIASVSAALIVSCTEQIPTASNFNPEPIYQDFGKYSTTISEDNDLTDIYYPQTKNSNPKNNYFPVALLLQGANVDKSSYSQYASIVARYGFIVVVPNRKRTIQKFNQTGLFAETSQVENILTQLETEKSKPNSPIKDIVDTDKLALLGHSLGGYIGLSAIANICLPAVCEGSFERPKELAAGIFFGTSLRNQATDEFIPINNSRIPTALIQGTAEGVALPFRAEKTYNNIQNPPKALINLSGANHYGITNTNNPDGPRPDPSNPTIPQDIAVETIARWSGLFLRASVLNDKEAFNYVYSTGDALDKNVEVTSQTGESF
ncbi:MAG: alpha/beta hydrolase [Cyanobacteria bacterium J06573_2]